MASSVPDMSQTKKGVRYAAREAMQRHGYDPIDVMVQCSQDPNTAQETKLDIARTLMPYMYPKLSNVTVESEVSNNERQETQSSLMMRILANPELADAAQRLSIAAADAALEYDSAGSGRPDDGPSPGGFVQ
jgi:hypothetical protein